MFQQNWRFAVYFFCHATPALEIEVSTEPPPRFITRRALLHSQRPRARSVNLDYISDNYLQRECDRLLLVKRELKHNQEHLKVRQDAYATGASLVSHKAMAMSDIDINMDSVADGPVGLRSIHSVASEVHDIASSRFVNITVSNTSIAASVRTMQKAHRRTLTDVKDTTTSSASAMETLIMMQKKMSKLGVVILLCFVVTFVFTLFDCFKYVLINFIWPQCLLTRLY